MCPDPGTFGGRVRVSPGAQLEDGADWTDTLEITIPPEVADAGNARVRVQLEAVDISLIDDPILRVFVGCLFDALECNVHWSVEVVDPVTETVVADEGTVTIPANGMGGEVEPIEIDLGNIVSDSVNIAFAAMGEPGTISDQDDTVVFANPRIEEVDQ